MKKRVVITGSGGVTPFGNEAGPIFEKLKKCENAVKYMEDWEKYEGLHTKLAAPILDFKLPENFDRFKTRSMGRVSKFATLASEYALKNADFLGHESLNNGETGVAFGSSTGSTPAAFAFANMLIDHKVKGLSATTYLKMMPHTAVVNVSLFFGVKGRIITTSTACTSGSQAIGYSFEAIQHGLQKAMIAGGAEELCPTEAAVFDTLFATSTKNTEPKVTPAPFDSGRDGLVLGEGAGAMVLEELEHAKSRGARIQAEIVGFATNCDAAHITRPSAENMQKVMEMALENAGLSADAIGYVNAHGTGTEKGDIAESMATEKVFGSKIPFSGLKGYFGHTLGACGAVETWLSMEMMNRNWFAPTINLKTIDENCGNVDYILGKGRELNVEYIMCNNFAFGGINTSIILKRYQNK